MDPPLLNANSYSRRAEERRFTGAICSGSQGVRIFICFESKTKHRPTSTNTQLHAKTEMSPNKKMTQTVST